MKNIPEFYKKKVIPVDFVYVFRKGFMIVRQTDFLLQIDGWRKWLE